MKLYLHTRIILLASAAAVFGGSALNAAAATSPDRLWQTVSEIPAARTDAIRAIQPRHFQAFTADGALLKSALAKAPVEFTPTRTPLAPAAEITLPKPDGSFARFQIEETAVMEPALAAKFPEIKSYRGRGIDDPAASLRLDVNGRTMHAQVLSPSGAYYIDPYWHLDGSLYMSYHKSDLTQKEGWKCQVEEAGLDPEMVAALATTDNAASGQQLRTYRLAIATSIRYSQFHSADATNPTVPEVMAALVTLNNRVSGIYEKELAIRMVLVADNDLLIATVDNPQPYTDTPSDLEANPTNIDARIGSAAYDIGHVVTLSPGGAAGLGVVCRVTAVSGQPVRSLKARGYTGFDPPVGDPFWVDYVAHEMGHQFAGNHTFNGNGANCGAANQNPNTAYEPGSGSTIQAYAGICGAANNLQPNSDPYFHFISLQEIFAFSNTGAGNSCPAKTPTGNNPPTVSARPSGVDVPPAVAYTIPSRTPFSLSARNGTDPDGDGITYCWEEADLGPEKAGTAPDNGSSPLFRSFLPTASPTRTFPRLPDLLANNTQTIGEKLPTTTRKLDFRVTVRDNRPIGGFGMDIIRINVVDNGQAFEVTSPNAATDSLVGGGNHTVTWNPTNTASAPVNAANVNIRLSTNGGNSFDVLLAANTPNDGSESVTVPFLNTSTARIKVEPTNNIFFDISNANFTIVSVDADGDGIPDGFETANGLNPADPTDGGQDFDGDGASNFAEYVAGTNLSDRNSVLKIVSIERTGSSATVNFTSVAGRRYRIEATPDLTGTWSTISGDLSGTGEVMTFSDPNGGSGAASPLSKRFYRARVFQ
jgi:hypothetical protein